jgi:hypothetical protein
MRIVADFTFQYESGSDKRVLYSLSHHEELVAGAHCVYVYSLAEAEIPYPNAAGSVIYIGEVCRVNEPSGKRFGGHISKSLTAGNNYTTNHTVTAYYYARRKLRLQIYRLDACEAHKDRKLQEKRLIAAHVKRFGAQPIGQGTTGPSYTPKAISKLALRLEEETVVTPTRNSTPSSLHVLPVTRKPRSRSAPVKASISGPSQTLSISPVSERSPPGAKSTNNRPARGLRTKLPNILK